MAGPCLNCGAQIAPYGYRRKGSFSSLPENRRTMIFVCAAPACTARAEDWKAKADGEILFNRAAAEPSSPPKKDSAQGSLF